MIGKVFSHFKILEKIGEGGMGTVYKAEDLKLGRIVALKFLAKKAVPTEEDRRRFIREAKSAAALHHPGICTIYDIYDENDELFIAMAFLEGETLSKKIKNGSLQNEEIANFALQIAEGLEAAHRKGIVHRDIKSANIMITPEGRAIILDFGLAKSSDMTRITTDGSSMGTVAYMSPEQARGEEMDFRTDIWSLAVIIYEMLTGRLPFDGSNLQAIIYKILTEQPERMDSFRSGIPKELESIVGKGLEKKPVDRYQTISQMVAELKSVRDRLLLSGTPTVPLSYAKPRKKLYIILAAVVCVCITAFVLIILSPSEAEPGQKSIAVLPFDDLSPRKDLEYFCDGVTEQIITNLTRVPELKVIARTSVMLYRGNKKTVKEIAEELGVQYILEGSVRKNGNKLRITSQLISVADGDNIWTDEYNFEIKNIFTVQDQISENIAAALKVSFDREFFDSWKNVGSVKNVEVYQYWLKARNQFYNWYLKTYNEDEFQAVLEYSNKVLELQPDYALGYAMLSYYYEGRYFITGNENYRKISEEYLQKALKMEPDNSWVLAGMSYFLCDKEKYNEAYKYIKKALNGAPNDSYVLYFAGLFSNSLNLYSQGSILLEKAMGLDPINALILEEYSGNCFWLGNFKQTKILLEKGRILRPESRWIRKGRMLLALMLNDHQEAANVMKEIDKLNIDSEYFNKVKAYYLASSGKKEALNFYKDAFVYAWLGMNENAIQLIIEKTENTEQLDADYNYYSLANMPVFDEIRKDPRMHEIIKNEKAKLDRLLIKYKLTIPSR